MRNAYRKHRSTPATARAYLELIRTTVYAPPALSKADKARLRAELALPRRDEQRTKAGDDDQR